MRARIEFAKAATPQLVLRIAYGPSTGTPPGRDLIFSPASVSRVLIMAEVLAGILRWYAEMGIDIAIDDAPHDRFAESRNIARDAPLHSAAPPTETMAASRRVVAGVATALSAGAIEANAMDQAAAAQSLGDLRERLSSFEGCGLKATATRLVFADGNPATRTSCSSARRPAPTKIAKACLSSAAPGQLLDKMLASIGLDRKKFISPMSCLGGRLETARLRRLKRRPVCPSPAAKSSSWTPDSGLPWRGGGANSPWLQGWHHAHARTLVRPCGQPGNPGARHATSSLFVAPAGTEAASMAGFADARQGNQPLTALCRRQWRERRDLNPRPPA